MEFGKFTELTFANGGAPAINDTNLNEIERVVKDTDVELSRSASVKLHKYKEYMFLRNTNVLVYFTYYGDWTNNYPLQVDLSDEQSENLMGNDALKMENILNTAGWMSIAQILSTTKNFAVFFDGSTSTTDDIVLFMFYVSDAAAFSSLEFRFGDDFSNSYYISLAGTFSTGWNCIFPQKSDFTTMGSPTGWDSIDYVRIAPYVDAGYLGEYIYFQYIGLARQDPDYSGYPSTFQEYMGSSSGWENVFSIVSDVISVYRDYCDQIEKIGIMKMNNDISPNQLHFYCDVINFISKWEFYCKYAGESASVSWYVDSSNFFEVYITSDTFYLEVTEAGVASNVNVALTNSLEKNQSFYFFVEKDFQTIRAILVRDGEKMNILEYETSISASTDGCVCVGRPTANSWSILTDFEIGNRPIAYLEKELLPRFIKQFQNQQFSSNTMQDVTSMIAYFRPNQIYKVEAFINVFCSDTGPDVKIAWDSENLTFVTGRYCIGPSTSTSDTGSTTVKDSYFISTTAVTYGLDGTTNESYIHETFFVLAQIEGATLQLQAAQNNTDAAHPTHIQNSSLLITPVNRDLSQ